MFQFDITGGGFNLTWLELWTRRRSYHANASGAVSSPLTTAAPVPLRMHPPPVNVASPGDLSMMAWEDYWYGYLFLSRSEAAALVASNSWQGGYNFDTLERMERYSFAG